MGSVSDSIGTRDGSRNRDPMSGSSKWGFYLSGRLCAVLTGFREISFGIFLLFLAFSNLNVNLCTFSVSVLSRGHGVCSLGASSTSGENLTPSHGDSFRPLCSFVFNVPKVAGASFP